MQHNKNIIRSVEAIKKNTYIAQWTGQRVVFYTALVEHASLRKGGWGDFMGMRKWALGQVESERVFHAEGINSAWGSEC